MKKAITITVLLTAALNAYAGVNALQISDLQVGRDAGTGVEIVTGVATNTSDAPVKSAFVHFNLYDAQGDLVGNTIANGSDIGPGERWTFKAYTPQQFDHAKLISVDTY